MPYNAQSWMLSLGDTSFHALTSEMQSDMLQHKFEIPLASRGLTKSEQLGALNDVRTAATRSHERSFLAHKTIAKQVQASLAMSTQNIAVHHHLSTGYEAFEDYTHSPDFRSHDGAVGHDENAQSCNYRSQAEQTMQRYGNSSRDGAVDNYVQQFESRDRKRYQKQCAPPYTPANFPVRHRGCYHCGDSYDFSWLS